MLDLGPGTGPPFAAQGGSLMLRRSGRVLLAGGLLLAAVALRSPSRADDFGKVLERAAARTLRHVLPPQDSERPVTTPGKRQRPVTAAPPGLQDGLLSTLVPGLSPG